MSFEERVDHLVGISHHVVELCFHLCRLPCASVVWLQLHAEHQQVGSHADGVCAIVIEQRRTAAEGSGTLCLVGVEEQQLLCHVHHKRLVVIVVLLQLLRERLAGIHKQQVVGCRLLYCCCETFGFCRQRVGNKSVSILHHARHLHHGRCLEIGTIHPRLFVQLIGNEQIGG